MNIHRLLVISLIVLTAAGQAHGVTVGILTSTKAGELVDADGDDDLNDFYVAAGVESMMFSGAVTDAVLAGVDLVVLMLPDDAFAAAELMALTNHLADGGRILFMGEHGGFAPDENAWINAALSGLGSNMALGTDSIDPGFRDTVADQILNHPLTIGVNIINYANVNSISGLADEAGLFLATNQSSRWGGIESLRGGTVILLAEANILSHIEDTAGNDNHVFFRNLATCSADLNGDGQVSPEDLAALLGAWGPCPGCMTDLNGDNMVNPPDLAQMLGSWGPCS